MKKITVVVAALALSVLPISAFAASTTTTKPAAAVTKPMAAVTAAPMLTDKSAFADVMASLSAPGKTDLSKVTASSKVTIVKVSTLKGYSASAMKLSAPAMKSVGALDTTIAANVPLTAALKKGGYLPTDVDAVSVDAKGGVTVFVAK
ncbi:MAG: hypothetical protein ABI216_21000 [Devosia sp.]